MGKEQSISVLAARGTQMVGAWDPEVTCRMNSRERGGGMIKFTQHTGVIILDSLWQHLSERSSSPSHNSTTLSP